MRKITLILLFTIILIIPNAFAQVKNEGVIPKFGPDLGPQFLALRLPQTGFLPDLDSVVWCDPTGKRTVKEEYSFDQKGNLTLLTSYEWNTKSSNSTHKQWNPRYKTEISYDEPGQNTSTIYSMKTNDATGKTEWTPLLKTVNRYNENGYMIQKMDYSFSPYPEEKSILKRIENRTIKLDPTSSSIVWLTDGTYATRYEYNKDGNIEFIADCVYTMSDGITRKWSDMYIKTYTYDDKNVLIEFTSGLTLTATGYHNRLVIKYDDQSRPISADIILVDNSYLPPVLSPVYDGYLTAYYKNQPTGLNKIDPANINIWSNDQFIHIESESNLAYIRIYNLSGNLLYQATSKGNTSIIPSPVRHGIFLVNVKDVNGKSKTGKIRIQ